jgi:hypothetical protein
MQRLPDSSRRRKNYTIIYNSMVYKPIQCKTKDKKIKYKIFYTPINCCLQ